jgi:hypothetical protein
VRGWAAGIEGPRRDGRSGYYRLERGGVANWNGESERARPPGQVVGRAENEKRFTFRTPGSRAAGRRINEAA